MRIPKIINVNIINMLITTNNTIKYLGVAIDNINKYTMYLETVCDRADALVGVLRGLLTNVNGPTNLVRKLYYNVWELVIL